MINQLKENQIFIFGSNLLGHHLGGAAKQAYEQFGAVWGYGEGLAGKSYAFPTLDKNFNKRTEEELISSIRCLLDCLDFHPDKEFILTKVGTGIAGFSEEYIKNLFKQFQLPNNLILPNDWK